MRVIGKGRPHSRVGVAFTQARRWPMVRQLISTAILILLSTLLAAPGFADEYSDTVEVFRKAGESGQYFQSSIGYAVFPTIGKGGIGIGGAYGEGKVYRRNAAVVPLRLHCAQTP